MWEVLPDGIPFRAARASRTYVAEMSHPKYGRPRSRAVRKVVP